MEKLNRPQIRPHLKVKAGARRDRARRRQRGFTLIELGVVLAVLAILVAIAVPTYLRMVARARESEAQQAWSMVKAELWSYYLQHSQFPSENGSSWWEEIDQPTSDNWAYSGRNDGTAAKMVATPKQSNSTALCWTLNNDGTVDTGRGQECQQ
ncbi:type II secretion system protein [Thermaerobacter sp. PB12/4term]|uniref:type IV pilin protein n=1 Tax=Thermaerobacter sp. PB12/4term TaxID=2293838 RepID=UPI000E329EE0|nr:type II secretion system protein [Thermaerobacter sp. PB12/4term]QIA26663.1 type II secretion system protein [Thermaerobacter sp. PB12/4term]